MKLSLIVFLTFWSANLSGQNWVPKQYSEFEGKFGYVDSVSGEATVFWHFDSARVFKYGLAAACYKGKWGCFDQSGNIVIPFRFASLHLVNDSMAHVDLKYIDHPEVYYFKGSLKNRLYGWDGFESSWQALDLNKSRIQEILLIDSEFKQNAVRLLRNKQAKETLDSYSPGNNQRRDAVWNAFQFTKTGAESKSGFAELKTGMYVRNKYLLSGISAAYQRTNADFDTVSYVCRQIPLYWTNFLFFSPDPSGTTVYSRLDLGVILSEATYKVKALKYGGEVRNNIANSPDVSRLLINFGFGIKIGETGKKSGFCIEFGYKFLPLRIPHLQQENFVYFSLGCLL